MRGSLRTKKGDAAYKKYQQAGGLAHGCVLCSKKALKTFRYWLVVKNAFPYDRIAKKHHMIIPKRHVIEEKLSVAEKKELQKIKRGYIAPRYQFVFEATAIMKSVPAHHHLHLLVIRD